MAMNIGKIVSKAGSGGKLSKIAGAAPGKAGGLIQKAVAGKSKHAKMPAEPVATDRGAFKIK